MTDLKFHSNKEALIRRMGKVITLITSTLILLGVIFIIYTMNIEQKACEKYMEQSVQQTASNLRGRVKSDMQMLAVLSGVLSTQASTFSEAEITSFLLQYVKDAKYHRLSFTYPSGKNIRVQANVGKLPSADMEELSCFGVAMSGSPCFEDSSAEPLAKSGFVNRYYVPVFDKNHKVVGVLGSMIDSDIFKTILDYNDYNDKGYSHVVDSDGNYLIKSANETNVFPNFFDQKLNYLGTTKEAVQEALKTHDSGTFWFRWRDGRTYLGAYAFIGHNNSYVLTDVPKDVIMFHINNILGAISVIVLSIGALLLFMLRYTEKLYRENEAVIYRVAFTDEVTESANKTKFLLDAKELLDSNPKDCYAMISMDITKFKVINELYGFKRANKILKDVYSMIKRNLTKGSTCARDFAATFAVLYRYDKDDFIVKYFVEKLSEEIAKYNEEVMNKLTSNTESRVVAKLAIAFGIYLINDKTMPITTMCDRASLAKRKVKGDVINIYQFYDDGLRAQILQDKSIEDEMYSALDNKQYHMYLQPKFNMQTMALVGAEALVRWVHPKRGIIPPNDFIPIFEKNGFVIELDKCIWKQACEFLSERKKQGNNLFPISVNVSRLHLNNDAFIDELVNLTHNYDIDTKYLELELTESACLNNESRFVEIMEKLKSLGFTINMDDFGTGYSSLNMLRHLPVDVLKLDRGFITDSIGDSKGEVVIRSVLEMANELNIVTVAEGIETPEQAVFLKKSGCKIAQGFLYGRPMGILQFTKSFLSEEKTLS